MRKLAIVDKERIDSKIEHLKKLEEKKYPFKPTLNERSKKMVEKRNVEDMKKKKSKKVESHYSQKNYEKKMDEYLQKKQLEVSNQTKLKIREIFWQKKANGMSSENALSNLILKLKMNHQG